MLLVNLQTIIDIENYDIENYEGRAIIWIGFYFLITWLCLVHDKIVFKLKFLLEPA